MKRILPHPKREGRPKLWRSLRELENDPAFDEVLQREFPRGAGVYEDSGLSRRDFVRLMGASAALAGVGLAGCRRPEAYLTPFTKSVEWTIPGKFLYYATAMPTRFGGMPLIAATVDGRPTKLEGNPLHPESNGGTSGFAQASILDLYDPFRSREIVHAGKTSDAVAFEAFLAQTREKFGANGGDGLAFLSEETHSPTQQRLRGDIAEQFPKAVWCTYEPWGNEEANRATAALFGPSTTWAPDFSKADVILALDSDFLNCNENPTGYSAEFSKRRSPEGTMNRLYVVENAYTLTGGMADHRMRAKASEIPAVALALASRIAYKSGDAGLEKLVSASPRVSGKFDQKWIDACADDLLAHKGASLVLTRGQQSQLMQALVQGINAALGSFNKTIVGRTTESSLPAVSIKDLSGFMGAGRIDTLFIFGGNPVYNAPADTRFAPLLEGVPNSVHVSLFGDETSRHCRWHVPAAHFLEAWGDARSAGGVYSIIQPMVLPLYGGVSDLQVLGFLTGKPKTDGPELVRETFGKLARGDADDAWAVALRNGFLEGSAWPQSSLSFDSGPAMRQILQDKSPAFADGFELVFCQSSSVDDGRYATNSWLLETPDFVTKVTWDNVAQVSPATAKALGVKDEDLIEIASGNRSVTMPALVTPGQADESITVALGYGRAGAGHLFEGVGFDVYPLRTTQSQRVLTGVSVKKAGGTYPLAYTQEHASMEGRDLAREGTLEKFRDDPTFAQNMGMDSHIPPNVSLYFNPPLDAPEQWGMTVDLNTCTGCNACVVACQAENNVPVVGKEQVIKGRDMAWIRIDRWFAGESADEPEMLAMMITCQQCENAPCETVCPVNATVHSEDGLNLMAYNRCIGTRYCANNCPWKVRRFNYFDYNQRPIHDVKLGPIKTQGLYLGPLTKKGMAESLQMQKNPNVTVRMRGVMEKCTFCIQRIEEAKIARIVKAGPTDKNKTPITPFKTACQQACPAGSITFGNINDPEAEVTKLRQSDRGYVMLKYLNARPRITYLARIKNPNSAMPGADKVGRINTEGHGHHDDHGHGHGHGHADVLHSGSDAHGAEESNGHHAPAPAGHGHGSPAHHGEGH